ncbi:MAG: polysaccharide deacetylase family protein [Clostridia bacterium]|nr:polysaccharide deacetylase family protein [Clostridia bacterium]
MIKRNFQRLSLLFVLPLLFFSACRPTVKAQPKIQMSTERITPIIPKYVEVVPPTIDDSVWDTSHLDISHIDRTRKLIAFTFDDAPKGSLENILAVFAAFNESNPDCKASATLFCNGNLIDNDSAHSLQTALALGLELGNHGYSHLDMTKLTAEEVRAEIDDTDELLARVDGKEKHLFRAPYGRVDEAVKATVSVPVLDWTIDTLDWTGASAEDIYQTVFSQKLSGSIVLMHDGYPHTVDALKRLLPDLKAEGYQAVSVSQLSKAHACPLKKGSVYIRARKSEAVK